MSAPYIRHTFPPEAVNASKQMQVLPCPRPTADRSATPDRSDASRAFQFSGLLVLPCRSDRAGNAQDPVAQRTILCRPPSENALETRFDKSRYVLLQEPPGSSSRPRSLHSHTCKQTSQARFIKSAIEPGGGLRGELHLDNARSGIACCSRGLRRLAARTGDDGYRPSEYLQAVANASRARRATRLRYIGHAFPPERQS